MSPVESPSYPEEAAGYPGHQEGAGYPGHQEGAGYEGYSGRNGQTNGTSPQVKRNRYLSNFQAICNSIYTFLWPSWLYRTPK